MNQAIATIIKNKISGLDFVDKISGLVSAQSISVKNGDDNVTKTYPVACCTTADDCKSGAYNDLCPNSDYKTVIYFEDEGCTLVKTEGRFQYWESSVTLVCWINVAKILGDACSTGATCTLSSEFIVDIIRELPEFPQNIFPFAQVKIEVEGQTIRSNSIFSKYTFDELQTQYLMAPYDYFALDIKTSFAICINSTDVFDSTCG